MAQGKFVQLDSGNPLTTTDIIQRIILNRLNYERRNKAKEAKEVAVIKKMKQMEEEEKKQEEVFKMDWAGPSNSVGRYLFDIMVAVYLRLLIAEFPLLDSRISDSWPESDDFDFTIGKETRIAGMCDHLLRALQIVGCNLIFTH